MNYKIKVNGAEYKVHIRKVESTAAQLTVNDKEFEVEVEDWIVNPTRMSAKPVYKPIKPVLPAKKPATDQSGYQVRALLSGTILDLCVQEGDTVKKGQVLYVLEAMKMENHIEADKAGVVETINYDTGDSVLDGAVILTIR